MPPQNLGKDFTILQKIATLYPLALALKHKRAGTDVSAASLEAFQKDLSEWRTRIQQKLALGLFPDVLRTYYKDLSVRLERDVLKNSNASVALVNFHQILKQVKRPPQKTKFYELPIEKASIYRASKITYYQNLICALKDEKGRLENEIEKRPGDAKIKNQLKRTTEKLKTAIEKEQKWQARLPENQPEPVVCPVS